LIYAPLPGEFVASAVKRGNEILGIKKTSKSDYFIKKIPQEQGKTKNDWKTLFPTKFEEHGVSLNILHENTLYPLNIALGRIQAIHAYTPKRSWKICIECVIENLEFHGTAYLHRRHLLTSVNVCSLHGCVLYEKCPTCFKGIISHEIWQLSRCSNSFKSSPTEKGSARHRYATMIADLLNYSGKQFESHHVEIFLYKKLRAMGYFIDYSNDSLEADINRILGIDFKFKLFHKLSTDVCSASAFLAYQTAEEYLYNIDNSSS
jgi:hypothetical protein